MPHLSPMSWISSPILFCLIFIPLTISLIWWSQTPSMPSITQKTQKPKINNWNW